MNRKEVLYLSICIFLTVIAWLVADIYHASTQDRLKKENPLPIIKNYKIDPKLLELIEQKQGR